MAVCILNFALVSGLSCLNLEPPIVARQYGTNFFFQFRGAHGNFKEHCLRLGIVLCCVLLLGFSFVPPVGTGRIRRTGMRRRDRRSHRCSLPGPPRRRRRRWTSRVPHGRIDQPFRPLPSHSALSFHKTSPTCACFYFIEWYGFCGFV